MASKLHFSFLKRREWPAVSSTIDFLPVMCLHIVDVPGGGVVDLEVEPLSTDGKIRRSSVLELIH